MSGKEENLRFDFFVATACPENREMHELKKKSRIKAASKNIYKILLHFNYFFKISIISIVDPYQIHSITYI
jgi:hypothetical protein